MEPIRSFAACVVLLFSAAVVNAADFDWFPSTTEMVGVSLPTADLSQFNKRLNRDVLDRFDFKAELRRDVQGRVRSKF